MTSTSRTALFALLAVWGVGFGSSPARAEELSPEEPKTELAAAGSAPPQLTNRVWVKTEEGGLPGVIRVFLSDGTLVQDSCWETHRLSPWSMRGGNDLSWNEDGVEIMAHIKALSADRLTLVLDLKGGPVTEHYAAAPTPSVCPDMPRA